MIFCFWYLINCSLLGFYYWLMIFFFNSFFNFPPSPLFISFDFYLLLTFNSINYFIEEHFFNPESLLFIKLLFPLFYLLFKFFNNIFFLYSYICAASSSLILLNRTLLLLILYSFNYPNIIILNYILFQKIYILIFS